MAGALAGVVLLTVITLTVGLWWALEPGRKVRERLEDSGTIAPWMDTGVLQAFPEAPTSKWPALFAWTPLYRWLTTLSVQGGYRETRTTRWLALLGACAFAGGFLAWIRTEEAASALLVALVAATLPIVYLLYCRHKRLQRFAQQLPDALDMITRALRAGYALGGAIEVVGEEMADPLGEEFRRLFEEIQLGLDPREAFTRLEQRVPTEDMKFFCTAINIQRSAGGNLAEILDRLAEVIRERYKLLSYARVLSVQHRWTAILVGLSPLVAAVAFELLQPGYLSPLLTSPIGHLLIGAGLLLEATGCFVIWRIAKITV